MARSVRECLSIFYQNLSGVKSKTQDFFLNLSETDYDCLALTETWLNDTFFDSELIDNRYVVYRKDRDLRRTNKRDGGGVILAVNKRFKTERLDKLEYEDVESLWVKIYFDEKRYIIVSVVYFPPNTAKELYEHFFERLHVYSESHLTDNNLIVIGDFNLRLLSKYLLEKEHNEDLPPLESMVLEQISYFNFNQLNEVKNLNGYCLDFVLTNVPICHVSESHYSLVKPDRHHPCLNVTCESFRVRQEKPKEDSFYNFVRADNVNLYFALRDTDWTELYTMSDPNEAVLLFYKILYSVIDIHVPKTKICKQKFPTWYTPEIKQMIKLKSRLHNKFKQTKSGADYIEFSNIRRQLKWKLKLAYRSYCQLQESCIKDDPNMFWNFIKNKKSNSSADHILVYEDEVLITDSQKCEAFAKCFKAVYTNEVTDINIAEIAKSPISDKVDILKIDEISENDLVKSFKTLKPKKSKGPDGLPQYFYKAFSELLVTPLLYIFNLSLRTKTFPKLWKHANVCPIPKVAMTKLINQHRPISLLSVPGKLFESVILDKITNHVRPLININQYGFVKSRSTVTNLVSFQEEITSAFNNKSQLDVAYTDFKKAFDLVSFGVLLFKLHFYGFSNDLIEFFSSYLCGRTQSVLYGGHLSQSFEVTSSVPQGSILAPLLFLIVINDLPDVIQNSKCFLFADDFKVCREICSLNDCILLQDDLKRVEEWCDLNKLQFNVDKCSVMTYSLKKEVINYDYILKSSVLCKVTEVKDLGVLFDPKLRFHKHVTKKVNEAMRLLGFIKRNSFYYRSQSTVLTLFNAFVRSKLEYCSVVWNPHSQNRIDQIERPQKRFLKYVLRKFHKIDTQFMPYSEVLHRLEAKSLCSRRKVIDAIYIYKILNNKENNPIFLSKLSFRVPRVATRSLKLFTHKYHRTNVAINSPVNRLCCLLNEYSQLDPFFMSMTKFKKLCVELIT